MAKSGDRPRTLIYLGAAGHALRRKGQQARDGLGDTDVRQLADVFGRHGLNDRRGLLLVSWRSRCRGGCPVTVIVSNSLVSSPFFAFFAGWPLASVASAALLVASGDSPSCAIGRGHFVRRRLGTDGEHQAGPTPGAALSTLRLNITMNLHAKVAIVLDWRPTPEAPQRPDTCRSS